MLTTLFKDQQDTFNTINNIIFIEQNEDEIMFNSFTLDVRTFLANFLPFPPPRLRPND